MEVYRKVGEAFGSADREKKMIRISSESLKSQIRGGIKYSFFVEYIFS